MKKLLEQDTPRGAKAREDMPVAPKSTKKKAKRKKKAG